MSNALATIGTPRQGELSVFAVNDPVNRGNRQTIIVDVIDSESKQGIAGVNINVAVTYASRLPIYEFNGKTDDSGHFSYSWPIDNDAEPGRFLAVVSATSERYSLRSCPPPLAWISGELWRGLAVARLPSEPAEAERLGVDPVLSELSRDIVL